MYAENMRNAGHFGTYAEHMWKRCGIHEVIENTRNDGNCGKRTEKMQNVRNYGRNLEFGKLLKICRHYYGTTSVVNRCSAYWKLIFVAHLLPL
jgi:hypothetical protein